MKKLILLAVTIVMVYTAKAQFSDITYGAKAGFNMTNISNIDQRAKRSFHTGVFVEWRLSDFFAIQPELAYSRQGSGYRNGEIKAKNNIDYVNLPILAKFHVLEGLSVNAGPQLGIVVGKKRKEDGGDSESYKLDNVNRFDLSLGVGVSYSIESLIFSMHYNFGLTNVFKQAHNNNKNQVFQISIGYRLSDIL